MSTASLAEQLAAAQAQTAGKEQVISLLRERLGLADSQNIALNQRLEESLGTVDKVTLALPPAFWGCWVYAPFKPSAAFEVVNLAGFIP